MVLPGQKRRKLPSFKIVVFVCLVTAVVYNWEERNKGIDPRLLDSSQFFSPQLVEPIIEKTTPEASVRSCSKRLDAMDAFFDQRRFARQGMRPSDVKRDYFDMYEPDAVCLLEERFGGKKETRRHKAFGDGPKFACGVDYLAAKKSEKNSCLVYSVGSSNDISFELAVKQHLKGCEIHTFDPTIRTARFVGHDVTNFHEWGLGVEGEQLNITWLKQNHTFSTKSFDTVVKDLGHTGRTIDILKIDCEGCEWTVMPKVFESIARGSLTINQVFIELHGIKPNHDLPLFLKTADKASMRTFNKERNGWGCDGWRCVEYSLASESWLREVNKHMVC